MCAALLYLVGYQGISTLSSGYCMAGGTFNTVSGEGGTFCLKDLSVKCFGTFEPTYNKKWRGGCSAPGGFQLMLLDDTGHTEKTYYWQYLKDGSETEPTVTQGWFKDGETEGTYVPLTAEELAETFPSGQGFYIYGNGNALQPAGQVPGDVEIKTVDSGYCVLSNGQPCDLTLGDLSVTCFGTFEPTYNKKWRGGCSAPGGFQLMTLDDTGHTEATYYWQYLKDGSETEPTVTQGWFKDDGAGGYVKIEKAELDTIEVKAGSGYYVYGNGNQLNFPGPEL